MRSKPESARRDGSMRRARQSMVFTAFWGVTALCSLVLIPDAASAKTVKGHIVDLVAQHIGNITVTIRTDTGDTKTLQAPDWRLPANLHFNAPVTIELDEQATVQGIPGERQTR